MTFESAKYLGTSPSRGNNPLNPAETVHKESRHSVTSEAASTVSAPESHEAAPLLTQHKDAEAIKKSSLSRLWCCCFGDKEKTQTKEEKYQNGYFGTQSMHA